MDNLNNKYLCKLLSFPVSSEVCYHHFFRPSVDHSKVQHPSPNEAFLILPTKSNHEPPHSARVGSPSCPWQIILDPRQKIKFILYSFGTDEEPDSKGFPSSSYLPSCSASLVFEENSHVTHEKLCRSSSSRKWTVFTSTWYSVTVYIRLNQFEAPGIHLLQYEGEKFFWRELHSRSLITWSSLECLTPHSACMVSFGLSMAPSLQSISHLWVFQL